MKSVLYNVFYKIIEKHLDNPNRFQDNNWVLKMCQELSDNIPNSQVEDIQHLDLYNMGHIDYHHKFALHCDELYQKNTQ